MLGIGVLHNIIIENKGLDIDELWEDHHLDNDNDDCGIVSGNIA